MNKINYKALLIGFTIIATIIVGYFGLEYMTKGLLDETIEFQIRFRDAEGIKAGDDVEMQGDQIGNVKNVIIDGEAVLIDVQVSELTIPKNSEFHITQPDIIGSKIILIKKIKPYSSSYIKSGDQVPGINKAEVQVSAELSQIVTKVNETLNQEFLNNIQETVKYLKTTTEQIDSFVLNHKDIISEQDKASVKTTIENINKASQDFNKISESIALVVDQESEDLQITLENINAFSKNLPELGSQLSDLTIKINNLILKIDEGDGTLSKLIDSSETFIDKNGNGIYDIGEEFNDINNNGKWDDTAELYNNANDLILETKELILDTKQNVNQVSENANNTINNMNIAVNNLNNILEEFQTDAGFKRMIKLYLRADREFKREK